MISLLVPFRANGPRDQRIKSWAWIEKRWRAVLPEAELCVGTDTGEPFSKCVAVNDAYAQSSGDMLVIADADSWVEREVIEKGLMIAAHKEHLVVPWWKAHRLRKSDSQAVMKHDPAGPNPVTAEMRKACEGEGPSPASAAMVLCIQRRAFERVGGMDPRFRGWGSEDVSFGLATWTLLGRNEYSMGEAFALYHPQPKNDDGFRVWKNDAGMENIPLYNRYAQAQGRPDLMTAICSEHPLPSASVPVGAAPTLDPADLVVMPQRDEVLVTAPIARETMFG